MTSSILNLIIFFALVTASSATTSQQKQQQQLRGSQQPAEEPHAQKDDDISSNKQKNDDGRRLQFGFGIGCTNLVRVVTLESDIPTTMYYDTNSGAVGAGRQNQFDQYPQWNNQWVVNEYPCPSTDHTNSNDVCAIVSSVHDDARMDMPNRFGQMTSASSVLPIKASQFWKITRDAGSSSNKITLSNAANGRVVIPDTNGNGRQLRYVNAGYPLNDRFWNLREKFYCQNQL